MLRLRVTPGAALDILLPLQQGNSEELAWQERASQLADYELQQAVAAQPPTDGEFERYHPAQTFRYLVKLLDPQLPTVPALPDLTRLGFTKAELQAALPALTRSLWILSYYADAQGQTLLSRNYLRLSGPTAFVSPTQPAGQWLSELTLSFQQPAQEHTVLYVPAGTKICWLELRVAVARDNTQRVFTAGSDATTRGLLALRLDPVSRRYQPESLVEGVVEFTELRPVQARNALAPVLNQQVPSVVRYQTQAGGGYLPLKQDSLFGVTKPTS